VVQAGDFLPADLAELITDRRVVRIALMRGTIHLVSARDCLLLRRLLEPVLDRGLKTIFGKQIIAVDYAELAAAGRALVADEPLTFRELGALLAGQWPGYPPDALAQAVRALVPLVQVPPRAVWGSAGQSAHTSAESWLQGPLHSDPPLDSLVTRYLGAFGPASVRDIQAWSSLTRLREVTDRIRPGLRVFRDEQGIELFDLPDARRPDPETPAPVRLVAEFDNLILSHADRSRVISEPNRKRLYSKNGIVPGTVLVEGFVLGTWRIARSDGAATVTIEPFQPIPRPDRDAIEREGERLLAFAAPGSAISEIRFGPANLRLRPSSEQQRAGLPRLYGGHRGHARRRWHQRSELAYGLGSRRSHCKNVRCGGRALTLPLPTLPDMPTRSVTGSSSRHGARTLTLPLRIATSSASTTMPGFVTRVRFPLRTSASIWSCDADITASVKSSVTLPLVTRTSIRCGTTQRPSRRILPLRQSMCTTSFGCGSGASTKPGTAGRSVVSAASSP
jgi:Winged helix DNA-binding domain